jgi:alpha-ketoglutarate-dependent taurine dioxygenase
MTELQVRRLTDDFGAEVVGWDGSRRVSAEAAAQLRELLDEHQLLLFRGFEADVDAHLAVMRSFGPLCAEGVDERPWSVISNVDTSTPDVFRRAADTGGFQSRLLFHQDYTWSPWPHTHLSLYAAELQGEIAATVFASNQGGYRALTDEQRRSYAGLHVMHAFELHKDPESDEARRNRITDPAALGRFGRTVQPMIRQHPRTGAELLYVTELFSSHIAEMPFSDEGEAVLQAAYMALYSDGTFYEHEWRQHDLLIWDNIGLQHARGPVRAGARRTLRRAAVNEKSLADVFADAQR